VDIQPIDRKPLRLWPGVAIVIVQWLLWFVVPVALPEAMIIASLGGIGAALFVLL
jgi:hypothetical protein